TTTDPSMPTSPTNGRAPVPKNDAGTGVTVGRYPTGTVKRGFSTAPAATVPVACQRTSTNFPTLRARKVPATPGSGVQGTHPVSYTSAPAGDMPAIQSQTRFHHCTSDQGLLVPVGGAGATESVGRLTGRLQ